MRRRRPCGTGSVSKFRFCSKHKAKSKCKRSRVTRFIPTCSSVNQHFCNYCFVRLGIKQHSRNLRKANLFSFIIRQRVHKKDFGTSAMADAHWRMTRSICSVFVSFPNGVICPCSRLIRYSLRYLFSYASRLPSMVGYMRKTISVRTFARI